VATRAKTAPACNGSERIGIVPSVPPINKLAGTLDKAIGDELTKDKAQIDALNKQIADLKSAAEASMNATFGIGIVISLIFIAISVYMTIQGFVSWALTATFTVMLAVLLALMRYEKAQRGAPRYAPARRAALSRASGWGSSASWSWQRWAASFTRS
jgi:hypothetical protein